MLIYLFYYLGIGAFIMVVAVLRTPYSSEPDSMVSALAGGVSLFDKMLAAFIAPLIACIVAVVAWPLVLVWKVQEMRDTKKRLAIEGDFPQPKNVQPGMPQIHARIDGKIVTPEEWDAARTQANGLSDSVSKDIAAGAIKRAKRK